MSIKALPRAGMVLGAEAYRSRPAAVALPCVGRRAVGVLSLIWRSTWN